MGHNNLNLSQRLLLQLDGMPPVVKLVLLGSVAFLLYTLVSVLSLRQRRQSLQRAKGTLPAVRLPQSERIFGWELFRQNLKALKEHVILQRGLERFEQVNAHTMDLVMLGRRVYLTREPEILKTMQATDHKIWSLGHRRKIGFRPLLGDGIFTTDGAEWAHSREMLRPNFVRTQVADLSMFERHVQDLIKCVPRDGSTVDLSELFFLLTIDSATEFLFGESINALTSGTADGFADSFNRSQLHIANNARFGMGINAIMTFFSKENKWDHDRKFIHDFVDSFVQKGMAKRSQLLAEKTDSDDNGRYVFMDELVRQTSDPIRIRSELLNILLAGRDTTASLLSNAWFVIAKRPDIWNKLQEEIAHLQGEAPTFEQIKELKYLRAVLNESLRLHPVVPSNGRTAMEDTTLPVGGGPDGQSPLFCPKGQIVVWSVYALHRRKDFYGEDAEEFRPERWLDDPVTGKKGLRVGWEYLPFNGGARICLGQQFALAEASFTTIRLMQTFSKIESRDSEPWIEGLSLTCTSLNGTKVSLTPRH